MSSKIISPFPVMNDTDGGPLDAGYVFVGEAGKNPEVYPIPVFWDEGLTVPAPLPIRTRNGYLSQNGNPGKLYIAAEKCSITIRNKRNTVIWTDLYADLGLTVNGLNEKFKATITHVERISDLSTIEKWDGRLVYVESYYGDNGDGGGIFLYDSTQISTNNGGTIFNGWLRQYEGDIDIAWFGAKQGENASPYIESALKISQSIVIRGSYLLTSIIGIPDQSNYANKVTTIRGEDQATLTVNCSAGAVFTSAAAKADPSNLANLYTGKINVTKINFIGTTTANSVIFNGDRLYNMNIYANNFSGNITIIKTYLKREAGRSYSQSCTITDNHLASIYRIIETDKAYNFEFSNNKCETCQGGVYIGVTDPWDPSAISLTMNRNLWEGGGLFLKTNGGIVAGSISFNYFENNTFHDAATEKCLISINRSGTGAGYSSGMVFDTNLFSGNTSIPDYVDVRYVNQNVQSSTNSKGATTKPPVFISNWSSSFNLTNEPTAVLIGNRALNRGTLRNAYSPQEGRLTFISGYMQKTLASVLSGGVLSLFTLNTKPCSDLDYVMTNFKSTFDITVYFKTSGGVNTASCSFKLDVFIYTPFGASKPDKSNLKAVMYNFVQSDTSDIIITGETMKAVISSAALTLTNNGDGTYVIKLGTFANSSSPNWGLITDLQIEYTYSSTLIGSITGSYSTANLLAIT
ncbi:hypothetical protein ACJOYF_18655 [Acinetobacter baumannii]